MRLTPARRGTPLVPAAHAQFPLTSACANLRASSSPLATNSRNPGLAPVARISPLWGEPRNASTPTPVIASGSWYSPDICDAGMYATQPLSELFPPRSAWKVHCVLGPPGPGPATALMTDQPTDLMAAAVGAHGSAGRGAPACGDVPAGGVAWGIHGRRPRHAAGIGIRGGSGGRAGAPDGHEETEHEKCAPKEGLGGAGTIQLRDLHVAWPAWSRAHGTERTAVGDEFLPVHASIPPFA